MINGLFVSISYNPNTSMSNKESKEPLFIPAAITGLAAYPLLMVAIVTGDARYTTLLLKSEMVCLRSF